VSLSSPAFRRCGQISGVQAPACGSGPRPGLALHDGYVAEMLFAVRRSGVGLGLTLVSPAAVLRSSSPPRPPRSSRRVGDGAVALIRQHSDLLLRKRADSLAAL
jgi:hypothetical protein